MISSTVNKQVKFVNALKKRAKTRREEGLFVAEGFRMCMEIPKDRIHRLYLSESFARRPEAARLSAGVHTELVSDEVFLTLSDTQTPQGVLALVKQLQYRLEDILPHGAGAALVMVLEHLQDPGNLGTILRAAEGAGVTGILMDSGTADIYNPKVIRSTVGSVLRVPFVYTEKLDGGIKWLKEKGIRIYAAHLKGSSSYETEDYVRPAAFLIGNEAGGLSDGAIRLADTCVHIPMQGKVESLNAAMAASVLMFEAARQRRGYTREHK